MISAGAFIFMCDTYISIGGYLKSFFGDNLSLRKIKWLLLLSHLVNILNHWNRLFDLTRAALSLEDCNIYFGLVS
jgi:hypothetical protein